MFLSILICSIPEREDTFLDLIEQLENQFELNVEMLWDRSREKTIGQKRNDLLDRARGEYSCFIDDDDTIAPEYIKDVLQGCKSGKDCISLKGVITWDGLVSETFEHSIKYPEYKTNETGEIKYERYPNHLNAIKTSIAKQFKFPEINHGEDTEWATQIRNSGLLKTEYYIDKVLYHYQFKPNK